MVEGIFSAVEYVAIALMVVGAVWAVIDLAGPGPSAVQRWDEHMLERFHAWAAARGWHVERGTSSLQAPVPARVPVEPLQLLDGAASCTAVATGAHDGADVVVLWLRVDLGEAGSDQRAACLVALPGTPPRMVVHRRRRLLGVRPGATGHHAFDDRFAVRIEPRGTVPPLPAAVRAALLDGDWHPPTGGGQAVLAITGGHLVAYAGGWPLDAQLDDLVRAAVDAARAVERATAQT